MSEKKKKLGIGYENYKRMIDDGCYYVDKTLLIRDVLKKGGMVTLFTRPRRFGKTLNLSMLRTFFELEYDREGNVVDNSRYFAGMKIMEADDSVLSKQGQFPVINLSLKSAKQQRFYDAIMKLRDEIAGEFIRHSYVCGKGFLTQDQEDYFRELASPRSVWNKKTQGLHGIEGQMELLKGEAEKYSTSLRFLSEILRSYHGKKVVILIDEYDVPLESSWFEGYYNEMVSFIRSLFESALKTNDALEFSVITGCLRISKESIFTGLNNLYINSIRSNGFDEAFGFKDEEVLGILEDYGMPQKMDEVREWYDGYLFGDTEIYNPWSVIEYVSDHCANINRLPEPYWSNTSSNSIIKDLIYDANSQQKREIELLMNGGTVEKVIHEDITYADIHQNEDNLWNFLFFTGYMKKVSERSVNGDIYMEMKIPNKEIAYIYRNQIHYWFEGIRKNTDRAPLYRAIVNKDTAGIKSFLDSLLFQSISYFDSDESFYQGFLLSLLLGMPAYMARSNREEGDGKPDIVLYPDRPEDPAYIIELKVRKKFNEMQDGIAEALDQIRDRRYEAGVLEDGYIGAVSFGMCFCKKSVIVEEFRG